LENKDIIDDQASEEQEAKEEEIAEKDFIEF
jgi:hypothetical protein